MEFSTLEIAILEKSEALGASDEVKDLNELQLTLVGGGVGEVIFG